MSAFQVYNVPAENFVALEKKLARLGKKAEKICGKRIYATVVGFHFDEVKGGAEGEKAKILEIAIAGPETIKIAGWTFAATVDHNQGDDTGNIIRAVPGVTVPERYRTATCQCDHCQTNRYRRDTFLLISDSGEWKQVGRNCLKDFTGLPNADQLAKVAEMMALAAECATSAQEHVVGSDRRWIDLDYYLPIVAFAIRKHGWCGRVKAREEYRDATADIAYEYFKDHDTAGITDDDRALAAEALNWAQNLGEDGKELSDFEHNAKVVAQSGVIEFRSMGIAAAVVWCFIRNKEREANAAQTRIEYAKSEFIGKPGDKITSEVRVLKMRPVESAFGRSTLIEMVDTKTGHNLLKTFARKDMDMEVGGTYKIRAKVKRHDTYKDIKSTMVNYLKVL